MTLNLFEWRSLTEAVNRSITVSPWAFNRVFPPSSHRTKGSRKVDIEILTNNAKLAGFTREGAPATVVGRDGKQVYTVTLPRISEKKVATANELLNSKGAGEIYVGDAVNLQARLGQQIGEDLVDLKGRIERRLEFMSCQALQGKITSIDSDEVSFSADFGFLPAHKITETGTKKWDTAGINLVKRIRELKAIVRKASGKTPNEAIIGSAVGNALFENDSILKFLHNNNLQAGRLLADRDDGYLGRFLGIDWYEYGQEYQIGDTKYDFFPENGLSLRSTLADTKVYYGPIEDLDAGGNVVTEFFSKSWPDPDPSARWIKVETNPLPVIREPNAFLWATVV